MSENTKRICTPSFTLGAPVGMYLRETGTGSRVTQAQAAWAGLGFTSQAPRRLGETAGLMSQTHACSTSGICQAIPRYSRGSFHVLDCSTCRTPTPSCPLCMQQSQDIIKKCQGEQEIISAPMHRAFQHWRMSRQSTEPLQKPFKALHGARHVCGQSLIERAI